jgi:hypothetical protein
MDNNVGLPGGDDTQWACGKPDTSDIPKPKIQEISEGFMGHGGADVSTIPGHGSLSPYAYPPPHVISDGFPPIKVDKYGQVDSSDTGILIQKLDELDQKVGALTTLIKMLDLDTKGGDEMATKATAPKEAEPWIVNDSTEVLMALKQVIERLDKIEAKIG